MAEFIGIQLTHVVVVVVVKAPYVISHTLPDMAHPNDTPYLLVSKMNQLMDWNMDDVME